VSSKKRETHPFLIGMKSVVPYILQDTASVWAEKAPPMLIESFLPAGGVMGITSYPGVGKTWLTLEIVRAISTGQKFLGKFEGIRGGVLFVGSDSSVYDYARQWKRLTSLAEGAHEFDSARFLLQSPFMFDNVDEVRRLIKTCRTFEWGEPELRGEGTADVILARRKGVDVIVFDTLSRLARANQNDNTEMEEVFRNIRIISELTGAACILLHHNAKKSEYNDGSDWRGAMSQIGALDSWCHLTPSRKDKYLVGVEYKKFRGIQPEDFAYRMDVNDPLVAKIIASEEPVTMQQRLNHDPLAEAIHEAVLREPGRSGPELRESLWPQFEATNSFPNKVAFVKGVDNRLRTLSSRSRIIKTYKEGTPIYGAPDAQAPTS
jgi:AAA domain-containing protein